MTENQIKEKILNRLHAVVGICDCCGERSTHSNSHLPKLIHNQDILRAINLDEHFFKEITNRDRE